MLRGMAASLSVGLAGCSALDGRANSLSISVENADERAHRLTVTLLRCDRKEYSDAIVDRWHPRLDPGEDVVYNDAVRARPYIVRIAVNGDALGHYHYYPSGCENEAENLFVWIDQPSYDSDVLTAKFRQSRC